MVMTLTHKGVLNEGSLKFKSIHNFSLYVDLPQYGDFYSDHTCQPVNNHRCALCTKSHSIHSPVIFMGGVQV